MRSPWTSAWERTGDLLGRIGPLYVIGRHRLLFAAVLCAVLVATLIAYLVLPASYMATGSVIVAEPELGIGQSSPTASQKIGDPADMESQLLVIRSPRVIRQALALPEAVEALRRECTAAGGAGFGGSCADMEARPDQLVEYVSKRYAVASAGRSRVINITYRSPRPDVARIMANALVEAFLDDQKESASTGRKNAVAWLDQQLKDLDATIRRMDDEIGNFRSSKGLVRGVAAPINSERLTGISQQLAVAQAAQAAAGARLKEVRDDRSSGQANSTRVLESRTVADLKQQISQLDVQLAAAQAVLGPMHPRLKTLNDQARMLNGRLAAEIARITGNAQKEYDTATAQVAALTAQLEAAKKDVVDAVSDERTIEGLVRDVEIKRKQYSDLADKANALQAEERIIGGSVRLVSLAETPLKPFFPKRLPFLAGGLTLGLLLGLSAAFLAERMAAQEEEQLPQEEDDDSGRRPASPAALSSLRPAAPPGDGPPPSDKEAGIRLLASLPFVRPATLLGYSRPLHSAFDASAWGEDMHAALARLEDALARDLSPPRTRATQILFTSPSAGGGKTFATLALARHAADGGRKVLIVECGPGPLDAFAGPGMLGLGDVLRRGARPQDALRSSAVAGLDMIVGSGMRYGSLAAHPDRLAALLAWARRYDLVLLDGPAADAAEASLLIAHVDAVAICTEPHDLESDATAGTVARIRAAGHERAGIVLTPAAGRPMPQRRPERHDRLYETA